MQPKEIEKSYPKLGDDIIQFFSYDHLPDHLKSISKPFAELAQKVADHLPKCPERTVCLRKLLEAKDAAVRSAVWKPAN